MYAYGERSASIWWKNIEADLRCLNNSRSDNLTVNYLSPEDASAIAAMAERNMSLQATVQEGDIWFGNEKKTQMISPETWKTAKD